MKLSREILASSVFGIGSYFLSGGTYWEDVLLSYIFLASIRLAGSSSSLNPAVYIPPLLEEGKYAETLKRMSVNIITFSIVFVLSSLVKKRLNK